MGIRIVPTLQGACLFLLSTPHLFMPLQDQKWNRLGLSSNLFPTSSAARSPTEDSRPSPQISKLLLFPRYWDEWRYMTALIKRNMTYNCVPVATTSHHRTWNSYHLGISLSQCSPLNARTNNRMCVRSIFSCSILLYAYYPQVTAYQSAAECLITQPKTLLAPRYVPLSISHLNIFRTQY